MTSKKDEPDDRYIELAEECHIVLEQISDFFAEDLLGIDADEIGWENVSRITQFRDNLRSVLASPIK